MFENAQTHREYDAIVIGAGFFGASLAVHLAERYGLETLLLEQEDGILRRASYANQARVHGGYHYPRSLTTGTRCQENYRQFLADLSECTDQGFEKYYAVARGRSSLNASQFVNFSERIGAPIEEAPAHVARLFDRERIEAVFTVRECAFDSVKLAKVFTAKIARAKVDLKLNQTAHRVSRRSEGLVVETLGGRRFGAKRVFLCTYAALNEFLSASALPLLPLSKKLQEVVLVKPPAPLQLGLTIVDGDFFSMMPFPAENLFSLYHVAYATHLAWNEETEKDLAHSRFAEQEHGKTNFPLMIRDAARYVPAMENCVYSHSLTEVKVTLPRNAGDDGRPILLRRDHGLDGFHVILGAKLDNIYDVLDEVNDQLMGPNP